MTDSPDLIPTTQVAAYFDTLSNWGRWGADDRRGTLNLITPEVRVAALASVRSGVAVSLSRDLDPRNPDPVHSGLAALERTTHIGEVKKTFGDGVRWDAAGEEIRVAPHGGNAHLDGLAHYSWDGKNYNGFDAGATTPESGAVELAVHHAADGIITRGVLLDIAALFRVEYVERGYAITRKDLEAAESRQGVTARPGDVLLIHTGNAAAIVSEGALYRDEKRGPLDGVQAGLDASALPYLRERDIAAMGTDGTHDVQPPQYGDFNFARPVHSVSLVAIGLWLMDNLDLTELAARCAQIGQSDFLFAALPWRFVGSTSSPLNPVAVL